MNRPDTTHVRLVDNKVVVPRPYAKTFLAPDTIPTEFLPLASMDLDRYYDILPAAQATPSSSTAKDPPASNHYTPAPTSSLLGTYEVVLDPPAGTNQVMTNFLSLKISSLYLRFLPPPSKDRPRLHPCSVRQVLQWFQLLGASLSGRLGTTLILLTAHHSHPRTTLPLLPASH